MASRNGLTKKLIPGDASDPAGLTALLYRYLVWLETHHFAENTVNIRRLQLSRFITWCDDRSVTLARQVTPELIERFQRHLYYYRKKDGQPLSISSQSHWLTSLRSWMKWMKDQRIVELNPALEMVFPKEEKRLPRHALTQEEVEAVLAQPDITRPCGLRMRSHPRTALQQRPQRARKCCGLEQSDIDRAAPRDPGPLGQGQEGSLRAAGRAGPALAGQIPGRGPFEAQRRSAAAALVRQHHRQRAAPQLHLVAGAPDDEPSGHRQGGILPSVSPYGGHRSCWTPGRISGICRRFSGMRASARRKSTHTYRSASSAKCTPARIRPRLFRAPRSDITPAASIRSTALRPSGSAHAG